MSPSAALKSAALVAALTKADPASPAFVATGRDSLSIKAGTILTLNGEPFEFDEATAIVPSELTPGQDYQIISTASGVLFMVACGADIGGDVVVGGFHFAPGGNAEARSGGDAVPAINPHSIWDLNFRPSCADARGMTLIDGRFWCDIYLCGSSPHALGTSRFGATIADDRDRPLRPDGKRYPRFDYEVATAVYAAQGKQLLSIEEFFAAAFGVTEATSAGDDPRTAGLDAPHTSKWGVMQATGNMSTWGHDGDPEGPRRACRFGGSWVNGSYAGSRYAYVVYWPDDSYEWLGARGRSDHLQLA
ncbi:MAG: hypothetical protein WC829_02160 [Hyphomicrobium sp.]|jgi:hypothetical protein